MIQPIMKNEFFLHQPSEPATPADKQVVNDLLDTLAAHQSECVGMASNMIGVKKNIIAVSIGMINVAMLNPKIVKRSGTYETEEGCLSLSGTRKTARYKSIELQWQDLDFKTHRGTFTGFTAQIIQHECDHLKGIVI